jgi:hypothetical protein
MVIQRGHRYTVQFRAWASQETDAYPKAGMSGPLFGSTAREGQGFVLRIGNAASDPSSASSACAIGHLGSVRAAVRLT